MIANILVVVSIVMSLYFIARSHHYRQVYRDEKIQKDVYEGMVKKLLTVLTEEDRIDLIERAGFVKTGERLIDGLGDVKIPDGLPEDF